MATDNVEIDYEDWWTFTVRGIPYRIAVFNVEQIEHDPQIVVFRGEDEPNPLVVLHLNPDYDSKPWCCAGRADHLIAMPISTEEDEDE